MLCRALPAAVLSAGLFTGSVAFGDSPEAISRYFEGKQVTVKIDMPGTQKGIEIRPDKTPPLDVRSYSQRLKDFGVSLHKGDSVMITKVKVKSDNIEFQLGGGGFGTAGDNTDASVHFTAADKSSHEKELEDQLSKETDEDRRRSLSRELDDLRRDRERQDRRNRGLAEQDADYRRQQIYAGRSQGGSRFNIRFDKHRSGDALNPDMIMQVLADYVSFSPEPASPSSGVLPPPTPRTDGGPPAPPGAAPADVSLGLRKGLTRAQVENMFGPAREAHDRTQDGLTITTCTYQSSSGIVQADFVNGVLVQYTISSR